MKKEGVKEAAEKLYKPVILSAAKDLAFLKQTTYKILRRLRLLRMTSPGSSSAACKARRIAKGNHRARADFLDRDGALMQIIRRFVKPTSGTGAPATSSREKQ